MGKNPSPTACPVDEYEVGLEPHGGTEALPGGQKRLIELALAHRTVTCVVGRSWGKTAACLLLLIYEADVTKGIYQAAYCTPTNRLARKMYRAMKAVLGPMVKWHSDVDQILELWPIGSKGNKGSIIDFWGLQAGEAKRGDRKHRIIVDECVNVLARVITRVLRWMLLGRVGKMLFIGTPGWKGVGAHWFKRQHDKGFDKAYPRHASMHGPSHGNPKLEPSDIAELIEDAEEEGESVEEEVYAQWLTGEGAVFRNLDATFTVPILREEIDGTLWIFEDADQGIEQTPHVEGRLPDSYVMGIDFGQSKDWTVAAIFNRRTRRMAALYRKRRIPYHKHTRSLHELRSRYNAALVRMDAGGGHGGATREWMAVRYGDGCQEIKWSTFSKEKDITKAQQLCEHAGNDEEVVGPAWFLGMVPWLRAEFESYQIETKTAGDKERIRPQFGAPPGQHDDGVCACVLAAEPLLRPYIEQVETRAAPRPDSDEHHLMMIDREDFDAAESEWRMGPAT